MATEPEPLPTDVICGRGNKKTTTTNPANIRFRALIEENKAAYQNSKHRDEKTKITCDVIDKMISEGSRFAVLDPTTNQWEAVSEEFTKEKVAHALRERPRQRKRKSMTTDDDDDADAAAGTATNTSTSKRKVVATVTTIEENHKLRDFVTNTHDCYKVPALIFYQWLLDHDIESLDNLCEACYEEEFVDTDMRMQGGLRLFKKKKFFKALMEAAPKAATAAGAAATPPQRATTNGSTFASMVLAATTMPHTSTGNTTSSEHSEDSTMELPTQHV